MKRYTQRSKYRGESGYGVRDTDGRRGAASRPIHTERRFFGKRVMRHMTESEANDGVRWKGGHTGVAAGKRDRKSIRAAVAVFTENNRSLPFSNGVEEGVGEG